MTVSQNAFTEMGILFMEAVRIACLVKRIYGGGQRILKSIYGGRPFKRSSASKNRGHFRRPPIIRLSPFAICLAHIVPVLYLEYI